MTTLSRQHLAVAINPSAAQGAHKEYGRRLVDALRATGRRVVELSTESYAELEAMAAKTVAEGIDALIVVGGDGTAQLGTNVCVNTDTPLGILPSGTGNDTAQGILGMPIGDVDAAIERLVESLDKPVRKIDAGLMTWNGGSRWFCSTMSAGFDALVNETVNNLSFPKGPSRYTVAMLIELLKMKPIHYTVTIDGTKTTEQAILTTIANNSQYGGGMKICPDAKPDDGLLDIMMVRPLSRRDFIGIYPKVFKGTHVTDPRVVIRQGKKFRLESTDLVGYSDGERIAPLPMDVEVAPRALPVLAAAAVLAGLADWWDRFANASPEARHAMLKPDETPKGQHSPEPLRHQDRAGQAHLELTSDRRGADQGRLFRCRTFPRKFHSLPAISARPTTSSELCSPRLAMARIGPASTAMISNVSPLMTIYLAVIILGEDFTLAEVRTLRAIERIPDERPGSAKFDGQFAIPTIEELLQAPFADGKELILELKHATHFAALGFDTVELLAQAIERTDWAGRKISLVFESFDLGVVEAMRKRIGGPHKFVFLVAEWGMPKGGAVELDAFLDNVAARVNGISFDKAILFTHSQDLVAHARARGLTLYTWTARVEEATASVEEYFMPLIESGVDGIFADQPDLLRELVDGLA